MMSFVHKSELHEWVGENVAYERGQMGWSQAVLAIKLSEELGRPFDQATVARLEKGRRPVDVLELQILGRLFDRRPAEIMDPPQRVRWRSTITIWRNRADDALDRISKAAHDFYEAMEAETEVAEGLAGELGQPLILAEAGRPDPKQPLLEVLEQLLARRPRDRKSADASSKRDRERSAEAWQLIEPVMKGLNWS